MNKKGKFLARRVAWPLFAITVAVRFGLLCQARDAEIYEEEPFNYSKATPRDGAALLQKEMANGEIKTHATDREMVEVLLSKLQIPSESQLLVFSRTSFQRGRIRPEHPRAIYFNDNCYVGWVPGGLAEVTTIDPVLGPMFYTFDPALVRTNATRSLVRDSDCLRCHGGTFVRGIPGLLARSVFPDEQGDPIMRLGGEIVDLRTPFTNRWGGWYVTGMQEKVAHRGNVLFSGQAENSDKNSNPDPKATELSDAFEVKPYLARGGSDIVALMIFEQQLTIQNTLTRASVASRHMLDYQKKFQAAFKTPVTEEPELESVKSVLDSTAQEVVDDLLFKGEAELPAGLRGSAEFQNAFLANARRTGDGKSLKDLHLHGHLFQNRCSYLIYSESFRCLPAALKRKLFARLERALRATSPDPRYAYIGAEERQRILRILRETNPEIAAALDNARSDLPNKRVAERSP